MQENEILQNMYDDVGVPHSPAGASVAGTLGISTDRSFYEPKGKPSIAVSQELKASFAFRREVRQ